MVRYGAPYKGSKNVIAERIVDLLPPADNFYDLFAGGGAITQCALESGKYKNIYANDIDGRALRLFMLAATGKIKNETRWISRDEFMVNRALPIHEQDPYVACCWSFGNNMIDYLYAQSVEPYKQALHYAVVFDEWDLLEQMSGEQLAPIRQKLSEVGSCSQRRKLIGGYFKAQKKEAFASLYRLENLERLQSLERLERLQSLERLERHVTYKDYRSLDILPNSVIYCDPPYIGTSDYGAKKNSNSFDYGAFYDWALSQSAPVFISEYQMPERFVKIASFDKSQQIAANTTRVVQENIYVPFHQNSSIEEQLSLF